MIAAAGGRGVFLVIVGPDGVGKTTLARALLDRAGSRGRYFHFIPSPIGSLEESVPADSSVATKNRVAGSRTLGLVRIARNLVRAWISYVAAILPAIRSGAIVVGDRWLYGYAAQPVALKFYGPYWVASLVLRLMPQPDLVIVLQAPPEVIRDRKADLSLSEIKKESLLWARVGRKVLSLSATRSTEDLADEVFAQLTSGLRFKKYPPVLGHVLVPADSRSAALIGSTLYTPARARGIFAQRLGRGMLRAFGTSWLPAAGPDDLPMAPSHWETLVDLLASNGLGLETIALYKRTQDDRQGYSVLVIGDEGPTAFVRVGMRGDSALECRALDLLDVHRPKAFRYPLLLGSTTSGSFDFVLQTVVLEGFHRPAESPPLDEIVQEIHGALNGLPKAPDTPSDWLPIHGDLTPWNLRHDGGGLSLIDWESVGWGPPLADPVLYAAASSALGLRHHQGDWSAEASTFWMDRLQSASNSRDSRLRRQMIRALDRGGSTTS